MTMESVDIVSKTGAGVMGPRVYVNGFPKSGLHLLNSMMIVTLGQAVDRNWIGNIAGHSWTTEIRPAAVLLDRFDKIPGGYFIKGHAAYDPDLDQGLKACGVSHILIYRDPRAVAVSQLHHIRSRDHIRFVHPGKSHYKNMTDAEALAAIIKGSGSWPGVVDRFALFEPWIKTPRVLCLRYEDTIADLAGAASLMLRYIVGYHARDLGLEVTLDKDDHDQAVAAMVEAAKRPELSPTYRKADPNAWRSYFDENIMKIWTEAGGVDLCARLGYQ